LHSFIDLRSYKLNNTAIYTVDISSDESLAVILWNMVESDMRKKLKDRSHFLALVTQNTEANH